MCDKNCGSGGTDVCTCRCQQVTAYKDAQGGLHSSEANCKRENERIQKSRILGQACSIFQKVFEEGDRDYFYTSGYQNCSYAVSILGRNWRQIRVMLNGIQD